MQQETVAFMKNESRNFIKETTKHIIKLIQNDIKILLDQSLSLKEVISEKDEQLRKCCDRMKELNQQIAEYSILFNAQGLKFDKH